MHVKNHVFVCVLLGLCVTHTTDVQYFLVPLRTLGFADKGSVAHSVHVDQLGRRSQSRSRDE